jgi:hypothetical protein
VTIERAYQRARRRVLAERHTLWFRDMERQFAFITKRGAFLPSFLRLNG